MLMQVVLTPTRARAAAWAAFLGVDPASFPKMKSALPFKSGGWFKEPEALEAVFGYEVAELEQREVGDIYLIPRKRGRGQGRRYPRADGNAGRRDDLRAHQDRPEDLRRQGRVDVHRHQGQERRRHQGPSRDKIYKLPDVQVVSLSQVKTTIMTLVSTPGSWVFSIALIAILIAMSGASSTRS